MNEDPSKATSCTDDLIGPKKTPKELALWLSVSI